MVTIWQKILKEEGVREELLRKPKYLKKAKNYIRHCSVCGKFYETRHNSRLNKRKCPDCKSEYAKIRERKK